MKTFDTHLDVSDWPEPDPRFMFEDRPQPPEPPINETLSPQLAELVFRAAEAKAAPPDYVFGALLVAAGSLIGNARWAKPWNGWEEPPILWAALIGNPSMNKSPGLDAIMLPLKRVETKIRAAAQKVLSKWERDSEKAKFIEEAWKKEAKEAATMGTSIPDKPDAAMVGPKPELPRLVLSDATIEKLGVNLQVQPKGCLIVRDELAGWLLGMTRYAGGSSDRPFWLEAYGGRSFVVERLCRGAVNIGHLSISVIGNIQPDRLNTLCLKSDDDGLLSRFLPIWPMPAPITRPDGDQDDNLFSEVFERLGALEMKSNVNGVSTPIIVNFTEAARQSLHEFRLKVRMWEKGVEGLPLSFIGKLPGTTVRLSLVLALLDWALLGGEEPIEITEAVYKRAVLLVERYFLPMAWRTYGGVSFTEREKAGRRLLSFLRDNGISQFSSREIRRMQKSGLNTQSLVDMGIAALEAADVIRPVNSRYSRTGGRPQRLYDVNPLIQRCFGVDRRSAPKDKTDKTDTTGGTEKNFRAG